MLQNTLRCFARGFFFLVKPQWKDNVPKSKTLEVEVCVRLSLKFGEYAIDLAEVSDICQKFGRGEGGLTVTSKRALLRFLRQVCPPVWLGSVSCWKPAAGKPVQREKKPLRPPSPFLKGSSSSIPATVKEETPRQVCPVTVTLPHHHIHTHTPPQTRRRTPAAKAGREGTGTTRSASGNPHHSRMQAAGPCGPAERKGAVRPGASSATP